MVGRSKDAALLLYIGWGCGNAMGAENRIWPNFFCPTRPVRTRSTFGAE